MRVHQAFRKFIDLEAVAIISGGPPSAPALLRHMTDGGIMSRYLELGSLTVQLVEKPTPLWVDLKWEGEPALADAEREVARITTEWDALVAAWKAVKA